MKYQLEKTLKFIIHNAFYLLIISIFGYGVVCYSNVKAIDVPFFHMDGAFQTASGLFRLLQGELPGRDFYPYLGVGPIALIFPIFLIVGANLCASVFASFVTVYAANILSIAILIHLIWKPRNFLVSIVTACGLFSIAPLLIMDASPFFNRYVVPDWLGPMMAPGNSLRPLRAFVAYLAIFSLYFVIFPEKNIKRKFIYYGITIAVASLWSNDYALLTMGAIFLLSLVNFIKDSQAHFLKTTLQLIAVSIVSVFFVQLLVTGGHPLKLASYNFVDVANDQWWYFGSWLDGARVFTPKEITKILFEIQYQYSLYVLAASFFAIFLCKNIRVELFLVFVIGVLSLAGGVVACVGGHIMTGYFDGFRFWTRIIILLFGMRLIVSFISILLADRGKTALRFINVGCCFLLVSTYAFYANKYWTGFKVSRANSATVFYVPELGGYLDQGWKEYINYIKTHADKTTVEEYSGIWSALLKKPSIWPVDSSIHALGQVRDVAQKALQEKADIVVTSSRVISNDWLDWNISANYWFYKELFESYSPVFYSPTTIVWEKSKSRSEGKKIACHISDSKDSISLDVSDIGYYEVELKTNIQQLKESRYLTMFENNINFTMFELGQLSISPQNQNPVFPVYVSSKENTDFGFTVRPGDAAKVIIESCSAKTIPFKNSRVLLMSEGVDKIYEKHANDGNVYSDINFWDRGIATNKAGFFVFKDRKALADFKIGNMVQLPNKEIRVITALAGSGPYLDVYLDGAILNPDKVGRPSQFKAVSSDELEKMAVNLGDSIYLTDHVDWVKGVSLRGAGFIVPNTEKNRTLFRYGNRVSIPNTTDRTIKDAIPNGVYLWVWVDGDVLDSAKVGLPSKFKVTEVQAPPPIIDQSTSVNPMINKSQANAIKDNFFLTDINWINGVGIAWAGFFVQNTPENQKLFVEGRRVKIPNTDDRTITKVRPNGVYLEVYVTGDPMDGSKVGLPSGFKVLSDDK